MKPEATNNDDLDQIRQAKAGERLTSNVGFSSPNSPLDLAGLDPLPESGGVGAQETGAGGDLEGEDQAHDREIASGDARRSGQPRGAVPNADKTTDRDPNERTSSGGSTSW